MEDPITNSVAERNRLHALAIEHQLRFDQLATAQFQSGTRQIELRARMFDLLTALEKAFRAFVEAETNGSDAALKGIRAEHVQTLGRFNEAASEYASELAMTESRLVPLRDTLAAFQKCRVQLRQLGCSAPELIQHEDTAKIFESHAHELNNSPQDPAEN